VANENRKLASASQNIWYVLATIAGEPGRDPEDTIRQKNTHYWNGYIATMLDNSTIEKVKALKGDSFELPVLSKQELKLIQNKLKAKGFIEDDLLSARSIDLQNTKFPLINFSGYVFPLSVDFQGSEFSKQALFNGTVFLETAKFTGSTFLSPARFNWSQFHSSARFSQCKFSGSVKFKAVKFLGSTRFSEALFAKGAWFSDSSFGGFSKFGGSKFTGNAKFENCEYSGTVGFKGAVFSSSAWFSNSEYKRYVSFSKSKFQSDARFKSCVYKEGAAFLSCIFSGPAKFSGGKFLGPAIFAGAEFSGLPTFQNSEFKQRLDFGYLKVRNGFRKTVFKSHPPEFFNTKISENISWSDTVFPSVQDLSRRNADSHKDAYERLGLMMDRLKKHHDKHRFYRLEMRARRQMEKKWSLPRFINWSYEALSDYGYGVGRTASLWGGNILVGGALLFFQRVESGELNTNFWNALTTSFSNAHGFLGLSRGPLKIAVTDYQDADMFIPFNVIATAQTIVGAIFLFFLLLTLRNKFKMG